MLMRKLDLKRVRIDLHDSTLTPLEKVTQVLSKLGVAEPQSHPQNALPNVPWPQWPTLTVSGNDAVSIRCAHLTPMRTFVPSCEHSFVTSQGSAFMRFRRALDRQNITEALSAASELPHVGIAEALELCLLLRDKAPERYPQAALRWHGRLCREVNLSLEEAQAVLAALVVMAGERKGNAAYALADLLSRRGVERPCETLVEWAQKA
jgi:hypothetical protein